MLQRADAGDVLVVIEIFESVQGSKLFGKSCFNAKLVVRKALVPTKVPTARKPSVVRWYFSKNLTNCGSSSAGVGYAGSSRIATLETADTFSLWYLVRYCFRSKSW